MSTYRAIRLADGVNVPGIGYGLGTANFGSDNDALVQTMKTAIAAGYRHLDGAEAYGVSQASVHIDGETRLIRLYILRGVAERNVRRALTQNAEISLGARG